MLRRATPFALTLALSALCCLTASAQDRSASAKEAAAVDLYGKGVHAYFDGDYEKAAEALAGAAKLGSTDPRVFYFRGLTAFATGDLKQARDDFMEAANMEMQGPPQYYPVARSLERVQGDSRVLLEETRAYAKAQAELRRKTMREARYEQLRIAEERVLRRPVTEVPQLPEVDLSKIPNLPFPNNSGSDE